MFCFSVNLSIYLLNIKILKRLDDLKKCPDIDLPIAAEKLKRLVLYFLFALPAARFQSETVFLCFEMWIFFFNCFIISTSLCVLLKGVHTTGLQDSDSRESAACPSLYNHAHFLSDEPRPFIQLRPQDILRKEQTSCPTNRRQHVVTFEHQQNVHVWQQQQEVRRILRTRIRFCHFKSLAV